MGVHGSGVERDLLTLLAVRLVIVTKEPRVRRGLRGRRGGVSSVKGAKEGSRGASFEGPAPSLACDGCGAAAATGAQSRTWKCGQPRGGAGELVEAALPLVASTKSLDD